MDCPKCKLSNPPIAQRCDCGYDFETGEMKESYLTERDKERLKPSDGIEELSFMLRMARIVARILLRL